MSADFVIGLVAGSAVAWLFAGHPITAALQALFLLVALRLRAAERSAGEP